MTQCDRRTFLTATLGAAAALSARAQQTATAPRDWSGQTPTRYPDPDIVTVDNRFRKYVVGNTTIKRVYTGTLWAEGPAWNGVGRYLLWSDIPNNVQMRWTEEDGRVTVFRNPSGYSNGNTFDFEGRQLSCEHGNRRVARYEYNGTVTVIADKFGGKRLNSPNDIVVHPDGGIWFTDPTYGIQGSYEGNGRARPAQRHLLFTRLQKSLYRRHGVGPRDQSIRSGWQQAEERQTVRAVCERSGRRNAMRRRRKYVGGSTSGRSDCRAQRRTHWNDPIARELRQRSFRRHQAQSAVHGRESVAVHGLRRHHRRAHYLIAGLKPHAG